VRVAIAEDSVLLREGVAQLLTDAGIEVTARCGTADELLIRVAEDPPDAVIVDIRLPPTHTDEGMQAALTIRQRYPDVGVLVLSQYVEVGLAMRLLADSAEGVGYLLKDRVSEVKEFIPSVRCPRSRPVRPLPRAGYRPPRHRCCRSERPGVASSLRTPT
jgi:DNA-binding NarL/FixJ family response regulator